MYTHILVATDGSDVAERSLTHGLALARSLNAQVTIITVTEPYPIYADGNYGIVSGETLIDGYEESQDEIANSILAAAQKVAKSVGPQVETVHLANTHPAEAIIREANSRNCDLIVVGSHGRRGVGRLLLGSKTWEVVAQSQVPVLVVR